MQGNAGDPLGFRVPTPPRDPPRRPMAVAAAAAALGLAGLFSGAGTVLLAGTGASTAAIALAAVFAAILLVSAALVFVMVPWARGLGIAVAAAGVVFALVRLAGGTKEAALDLVAYGYVLFALGTNGPAFRRG